MRQAVALFFWPKVTETNTQAQAMKPNTNASRTTSALQRIFSIALLLAVTPASVNAQTTQPTEEQKAALAAKTQKTVDELRYALLDTDRNGWTDPWEKKYPEHAKDKNGDPDGDGLDNWTEMLDGTDPSRANKKGEIYRSPEQIAREVESAAKSQAEAEKTMAADKAELVPMEARPLQTQDGAPSSVAAFIEAKRQKAAALGAATQDKINRGKAALDDFARRLGIDKNDTDGEGKGSALIDIGDGIPHFYMPYNLEAADTISTDELLPGGSLGLSLTGAGTKIGLWDGGDVQTNHYEFNYFSTRVVDKDGTSSLGILHHPTHVAGTLMASGVLVDGSNRPVLRGMSYQAALNAYDYISDATEMPLAAANDDLRVSNHSYGEQRGWGKLNIGGTPTWTWFGNINVNGTQDYQYGFYSSFAASVDQIAYDAPWYLSVWAAANERGTSGDAPPSQPVFHYAWIGGDNYQGVNGVTRPRDGDSGGWDTIANQGMGKNVLTVTAVNDIVGGYTNPSQVSVASFSSFGPADDGRVKPDLSTNGVNVWSTSVGGLSGNAIDSGTSMAAPGAASSLNLLVQHYGNLFGGIQYLLASSIKGLAVHTADEAGNTGPDYIYGWGLMNTKKAAQTLSADAAVAGALTFLKQVFLGNGDYVEFTVKAIGGQPLKITLCWTDPPGTVPTADVDVNVAALVNDLDLRVTQGANTYYPWKLHPASPGTAATRSEEPMIVTMWSRY